MERSSPLAAMQPSSLPFGQWGCRGEAQPTYLDYGQNYGRRINLGPSTFNFRDLSMNRAPTDYFSLKPVRGSSPTASLAADLSQNFHIDKRYIAGYATIIKGNANKRQPSIAYSPSILVLFESLWDTQWPGYGDHAGLAEPLLIQNRMRNHATPPILLTRARERINGNITTPPQGTLRCGSRNRTYTPDKLVRRG